MNVAHAPRELQPLFTTHSSPPGPRTAGFSILETLIAIGILAIVSTALYLAYSNTLDIVSAGQYYSAASNLIESEVEQIRNMRYEDIGLVGGVPAGKLPAEKTIELDNVAYTIRTFVRNVDDPFDGTLGGSPDDPFPADYKLIEFHIECPDCYRFDLLRMTTTIAPRNLESEERTGNILFTVVDASGQPLPGAAIHVVNGAVSPPIDLTDTSNANGQFELIGVATSSNGYRVTVSKEGFSTERTYLPGEPGNPNPVKPDLTVAEEQLTTAAFAIDELGALTLKATDAFCAPEAGFDLILNGGKLIGSSPDVAKYSSAHVTDANGVVSLTDMEWDSYTVVPTDGSRHIAATSHPNPFDLSPGADLTVAWIMAPLETNGLLVRVVDQSGIPIDDAAVTVASGTFSMTLMSGRFSWSQSDWSGGQFSLQSGNIHTASSGALTLVPPGGPYASNSYAWLESDTVDLGTANTSLLAWSWNPASQPPAAGADSVKFQLAANNDDATWSYVGPDGTGASYFTTPGTATPVSLSGNRYLRYRLEMRTFDENVTPSVTDASLAFRSDCTPSGGAFFSGLNSDTYDITVTKAGFLDFNAVDVPVIADWQQYIVEISP